jgi:hypothetical protein
MKKLLIPLVSLGLAVGCGDVPTATDRLTPNFGLAGEAGCYAVSGAIDQEAVGPDLAGFISGDVEGTNLTVAGPPVLHGEVVSRTVTQTWWVTGGIVDDLVGATLTLEGVFVGTLKKLPQIGVNTRLRVTAGARKGNLTLHGTTDVSTSPISSHLEYRGVICP